MNEGWIFLIILLLFGFGGSIILNNVNQETRCTYYSDQYTMILDKSPLYNICLVLENGEELTIREYVNKHKYDDLEVRS